MDKQTKSVYLEDLSKNYDADPYFQLLDLYFESSPQILVSHHINSFNQFIEEMIPSILKGNNVIFEKITESVIIRYRLTFDQLGIEPPMLDNDEGLMYPSDAIRKNLTYSLKYMAVVTQWQDIVDINTGKTETKLIAVSDGAIPIAKIPVMVSSKYCNLTLKPTANAKHCRYDAGGYFIVGGSEKVVLTLETTLKRKPMVFTKKAQGSVLYYVRVQSRPVYKFVGNVQAFTIKMKKDNSLVVVAPRFKEISVFTLMRALGIETDADIVAIIADSSRDNYIINQLSISMNAANSPAITREEAMEVLILNMKSNRNYSEVDPQLRAQQKRSQLMKILTTEILPHVVSGTGNPTIDMLYKAFYIGYMITKLYRCVLKPFKEVEEYRGCDDRDSMFNKRLELTGVLLAELFDQFFKKMMNDCNRIFKSKNVDDKKPPNIVSNIKSNSIEQGLRQALSTGAFGGQSRKGTAQMLNRTNHLHSGSYMRRVIIEGIDSANNKSTNPRHLHNTQYGSFCPLETPTGPKTGIVKNLSMMEDITINANNQLLIIQQYLAGKIITLESVSKRKLHQYVKVFLNGNWLGVTNDIIRIHAHLREMRFRGELEKTVSLPLNYQTKEFHIYTDGGRLIRPYLTVYDNELAFKPAMLEGIRSWVELMEKYPKVIEYVDKEEEQNMMLAVFPQYIDRARKIMNNPNIASVEQINRINRTNRHDDNVYVLYTHCEIHPCMILGLISTNIPFPEHNQSPRGIFQYNQARQTMGSYTSTYRDRTDISYILYHPQIPIVASRASKYTGSHIFPAGENTITAIMSYSGLND